MATQLLDGLVDRLAGDPLFAAALRANPAKALAEYNLPATIYAAVSANTSEALRGLVSESTVAQAESLSPTQGCYTKGPQCSSACTKLGCFPGPGCPRST